ncbi:MAG: hypothetical protein WDM91_00640 [Rhizomicrobium sp.]
MIRAALACAALALASTAAVAGIGIPSIPVGLDHDPEGIIAHGTTNTDGSVTFRNLAPGNYVVVVDGKSLAAALEKLLTPAKKSDRGVSIGVGGLFGGGGGGRGTHEGQGSHGSHEGGGGVGLGISIPLGGAPDPKAEGTPLHLPDGTIVIVAELSIGGNTVSVQAPYCRDSAGQGTRIGFTVPDGAPESVAVVVGYGTTRRN